MDNENDWIELYNTQSTSQNIHGWILTAATKAGEEKVLVEFKGRNGDLDIPAGVDINGNPTDEGYLVVVNADPAKTGLAVGEGRCGYPLDSPEVSRPCIIRILAYRFPKKDVILILRDKDGKAKITDGDGE